MRSFLILSLIGFLSLILQNGFSQEHVIYRGDTINRKLGNGLKYGYWIYFQDSETNSCNSSIVDSIEPKICSEGNITIVEIKPEEITMEGSLHRVNGRLLKYEANFQNFYSVRDGWWIGYNTNKLTQGELSQRLFFEEGNLTKSLSYEDGLLKKTTTFSDGRMDTYRNSELYVYERWLKAPNTHSTSKTTYYPDCSLSICCLSDNYLYLNSPLGTTFLSKDLVLISNSDAPIAIDSIQIGCRYVRAVDHSNSPIDKLVVQPKDTIRIKFTYSPEGDTTFSCDDQIILFGDFKLTNKLTTTLATFTYPLGWGNKEKTEFTLKKYNNLDNYFLFDASAFSEDYSYAYFKNEKGELLYKTQIPSEDDLSCGNFPRMKRIDLNDCEIGVYTLELEEREMKVFRKIKIIIN